MSNTGQRRAERLAQIKALLAQGIAQVTITQKVGMAQSNLCSYLKRHGLRTWTARKGRHDSGWGRERVDPSHLTADQLAQASRLDIEPGRYAWLLTCPRDAKNGHQGPNPFATFR